MVFRGNRVGKLDLVGKLQEGDHAEAERLEAILWCFTKPMQATDVRSSAALCEIRTGNAPQGMPPLWRGSLFGIDKHREMAA